MTVPELAHMHQTRRVGIYETEAYNHINPVSAPHRVQLLQNVRRHCILSVMKDTQLRKLEKQRNNESQSAKQICFNASGRGSMR